jgi:hypothetical protein
VTVRSRAVEKRPSLLPYLPRRFARLFEVRCLARPFEVRQLPRARAALPLAPADRFPVSLENASRTRPANLWMVPSALSRDPDFIAALSSRAHALVDALTPRRRSCQAAFATRSVPRTQTSRRSSLPTPCRTPRSNPKTPAKRPPTARPKPRSTPTFNSSPRGLPVPRTLDWTPKGPIVGARPFDLSVEDDLPDAAAELCARHSSHPLGQ